MEPQIEARRQPNAPPPTALVVDDDLGCREVLAEFLRIWGFEVESAANGREALERLHELHDADLPPSVILLDLMMPEMSGWEFRREQLRDPRLADIPVVIVSAARDALAMEYGTLYANEHLKKPVDFDRLGAIIRRLVGWEPLPNS
jgi:CheY-like chemotaxis protein